MCLTRTRNNSFEAVWLKWFCGGGVTRRSQVGAIPHTHSNPTNLALFKHKITLYRFNRGAHTIAGAQMGAEGAEARPPSPRHFNHCFEQLPVSAFVIQIATEILAVDSRTYTTPIQRN